MRAAEPLVALRRSGGRAPADDELLDVLGDGTFTARRTVGGARIGRFAGGLTPRELAGLARDASRAAATGDAEIRTPIDGATEVIEVAGATARLGSNEPGPGTWRALVERCRRLVRERVTDDPVAALELVGTLGTASLRHAGTEPLDVDLASIAVQVVRMEANGVPDGRWSAQPPRPAGDGLAESRPPVRWVSVGPGWEQPLPFGHGLEPAPGGWLQVRVFLRVRDGAVRSARLYVGVGPVPPG